MLERALAAGELSYSAVRELTRVATRATEAAWIGAARGKNLRQIEELVAGHAPGALPDEPRTLVRPHVVRFELSPETYARLRQARAALDDEHGTALSDDELVAALCDAALDAPAGRDDSGRARYQIATTLCARCTRAGSTAPASPRSARPRSNAPSATRSTSARSTAARPSARPGHPAGDRALRLAPRRRTLSRAGCRSARGLEVHHIVHRADGGTHEPANLVVLASALPPGAPRWPARDPGTSDALDVTRPGSPPSRAHVDAPAPRPRGRQPVPRGRAARLDDGLEAPSARAVEEATAALGPEAPFERLVVESLRRCPHSMAARPRGRERPAWTTRRPSPTSSPRPSRPHRPRPRPRPDGRPSPRVRPRAPRRASGRRRTGCAPRVRRR